jgi:hypothetical protein
LDFSANAFDDEWGTGDDEIIFEPSADDEEDDVDDSVISLASDVSCPNPTIASGSASRSTVSQPASDFVQMFLYKTHYSLGRESRPRLIGCGGIFQTDPIFVFSFISSGSRAFTIDKL